MRFCAVSVDLPPFTAPHHPRLALSSRLSAIRLRSDVAPPNVPHQARGGLVEPASPDESLDNDCSSAPEGRSHVACTGLLGCFFAKVRPLTIIEAPIKVH